MFAHIKVVKISLCKTTHPIHLDTAKWFQELLWITDNSIKHHPFVQTELNSQIARFDIGPYHVLTLRVWVNLETMATKENSTFPQITELDLHLRRFFLPYPGLSLEAGLIPLKRYSQWIQQLNSTGPYTVQCQSVNKFNPKDESYRKKWMVHLFSSHLT